MSPDTALLKLGSSVQNRALDALVINNAPWTLILGGVHGDEIEGIWLVEEMRTRLAHHYPYRASGAILWAQVNPDGAAAGERWNGNNVDLNRNLPTKDWTPEMKNPRYPPGPAAASEPESRALQWLLVTHRPRAILTVHSFSKPQVNANGAPETGVRAWAEAVARPSGYAVTTDIGYPTPGSLGTYAGVERGIPTITLEIERGLPRERVLELHVPTVEAALKYWETK